MFLALGVLGVRLTLAVGQSGTALTLFSVGVRHFSYEQVGWLYSLNGIIIVTLQIPISWGLRRRHLIWMALGVLCYGGAYMLFYAGTVYAVFLLAMGILTIGENIVSPLQNTVIATMASKDTRGSYFGATPPSRTRPTCSRPRSGRSSSRRAARSPSGGPPRFSAGGGPSAIFRCESGCEGFRSPTPRGSRSPRAAPGGPPRGTPGVAIGRVGGQNRLCRTA